MTLSPPAVKRPEIGRNLKPFLKNDASVCETVGAYSAPYSGDCSDLQAERATVRSVLQRRRSLQDRCTSAEVGLTHRLCFVAGSFNSCPQDRKGPRLVLQFYALFAAREVLLLPKQILETVQHRSNGEKLGYTRSPVVPRFI